ncbi:MAG: C1 family peptidase, partial [Desulfobacteraceae bacterium]
MMRKLWWFFLFIFVFANGAIADPVKLRLNKQNAGTLLTLSSDTVAVIELEANPSTGYIWEAELPENGRLQILGREFVSSNPGMLGSSGVEKVYVAGAGQGNAELDFSLKRGRVKDETVKNLTFKFQSKGKLKESFVVSETSTDDQAEIKAADPATSIEAESDLPSEFDWCDEYGCTPIKNQGNCGACWAFATVGVFENVMKIQDSVTIPLSEQYLISCNSEGYNCTNGGWWVHEYHQWKTVNGEAEAGAVSEKDKPYQAHDTNCNSPNEKVAQIVNWNYVTEQNSVPSTSAIKQAIYNYGPVTAAVCVNTDFNYYEGGVFEGPECSEVNHGVVLVGWNDADGGYWILRNSYGSDWGEDGYMRIKYGVSNVGYGASYVEYSGSSDLPDSTDDSNNDDADDSSNDDADDSSSDDADDSSSDDADDSSSD